MSGRIGCVRHKERVYIMWTLRDDSPFVFVFFGLAYKAVMVEVF
jgi:hypothetical protein